MTPLVAIFGDSRLKHWGTGNAVVYAPDGKTIISGGTDMMIRIWDAQTGQQQRAIACETHVDALAITRDGKRLAAILRNGKLLLWDLPSYEQIAAVKAHELSPGTNFYTPGVAFSGDGQMVVTGGYDGLVKVWNPSNGESIWSVQAHDEPITSVAVTADGQQIASASLNGEVKLWQRAGDQPRFTITDHPDPVHAVAFDRDDKRLASASGVPGKSGLVLVHDVTSGEIVATLPHGSRVNTLAFSPFSPDGQTLATGGWAFAYSVAFWNTSDWQLRGKLIGQAKDRENSVIFALAFSPDSTRLALTGYSSAVKVWGRMQIVGEPNRDDEMPWDLVPELANHIRYRNLPFQSIAISPDGEQLATAMDGLLRVRTLANATAASDGTFVSQIGPVRTSPETGEIVTVGDRIVQTWDPKTLLETKRWTAASHTSRINAVAIHPDGQSLATCSHDKTVRLWDLDGQDLQTFSGHEGFVWGLAFSPDGNMLASKSGDDKTVRLWNVESGELIHKFDARGGGAIGVVFSPDGKLLASCDGNDVVVWDVVTHEEVARLPDHKTTVRTVTFSPDGRQLASAGYDGCVRLWSVADWKLHRTILTIPLGPRTACLDELLFTPDSRHLITANKNGTAYVLRLHNPWPQVGWALPTNAPPTAIKNGGPSPPTPVKVLICCDF